MRIWLHRPAVTLHCGFQGYVMQVPLLSKLLLAAVVALIVVLALLGSCRRRIEILNERRREARLLPLIREAAAHHGLPVELVRSVVWKESHFDSRAIGSKGEVGLMQITGGAVDDWARVCRQRRPERQELFDARLNLEIGCWYLARCGNHWNGYASRDMLQLAEYNAGRKKVVNDWAPSDPGAALELEQITYPSTQNYVRQILQRCQDYRRDGSSPAKDAAPPGTGSASAALAQ